MATVAVIGMGLLGVGFAQHLIEAGHTVRVWNRTASKCGPVAAMGGVVAETPADCVAGADRVHLVLSEDAAVDLVIDAFADGLGDGVPVIDHSTNAPAKVGARVERLAARGITYLHAPVFMAPVNSRSATGIMLISGDPARIGALKPALSEMTGQVRDLGADPTRAATVKLTGNAMLVVVTAGMGDVLRIGTANGMSAAECLELFETFAPTPGPAGKRILKDGPPSFELTMARKDVRLMIEAAGGPDGMLTLPAIAARMDEALAAGHGDEDFARFARP
ncbi:MAG: NAD(P)-dependent oxidoreductase [Myxococcales bacterium]|nr:NAD(P)-dependent oxidoreductase [Myxococcales bacterium]MCB9692363.1 NAD(P)-dependent oxidoreductase [Alphaproteobacteria bacterium]